jgi:hypothetical protein
MTAVVDRRPLALRVHGNGLEMSTLAIDEKSLLLAMNSN